MTLDTPHGSRPSTEPGFGPKEQAAALHLIQLAFEEDLAGQTDRTCEALIPADARGVVEIVVRQPGILSGLPCAGLVFSELDAAVEFETLSEDGARVAAGQPVARITGPLRSLLIGERTALNLMTHLSGVATLTAQFVDRTVGSRCTVLDTRKTLPGYRTLQKYAVRCGGGTNHRRGLYDGVLIKDNHLAAWQSGAVDGSVAAAVRAAREAATGLTIEVEVDSLDQLRDALEGSPDIVLLDNMSSEMLREAVSIRDAFAPAVLLEASGGVHLQTIAAIAAAGVDRVSIGALTHSAPALDLAFDWHSDAGTTSCP